MHAPSRTKTRLRATSDRHPPADPNSPACTAASVRVGDPATPNRSGEQPGAGGELSTHDQTGEEMPDWVADKKRRAEKIRNAKAELEPGVGPLFRCISLAVGSPSVRGANLVAVRA